MPLRCAAVTPIPSAIPPLLRVDNLSLTLDRQRLVEGVSFQLHQGERVCLIGRSGSGKSLTARAITGTLPGGIQAAGSIEVAGKAVLPLHAMQRCAQTRVAAVFQDSLTSLNPLMNIGRQLSLILHTRCRSALMQSLQQSELDDIPGLLDRYPAELSGGQRQRVCLALALLSRAPLLVADEPTTALDVMTQQRVIGLLQRRQPLTLLFITHDIALAAQLCQRGMVMDGGQIVERGSMAQLLNAPQQPFTRQLVSAARRMSQALPQADRGAMAG
ncbi:dipeptide/oligopeptide/nickel ABC transporter ATP-binding protein [Erwinia sp. Leaf53]|nr:dipeptide/oligopeptide/nickel ABC transporter ATP-binding protein [Erwinia sp. Leaf53]